jgi:23S rRNA (cytosine1962-C5)-methyltransferase
MFSIEKIRAAFQRRQQAFPARPPALRLVDGEGDELPGLIIEDFASRWLAQTTESAAAPILDESLGFRSLYWKKLSVDQKGPPEHIAGEVLTAPFSIEEFGLRFLVDFQAGYSHGIFLDQRDNRQRVREKAGGKTVLNTFSYTCAFGVAAAAGGARTTNIDLSQRTLVRGQQNYRLNQLSTNDHEFLAGDVFEYFRRFQRKQRKFDLIILDPPTFSRDRRGKIFRVEADYSALVERALSCLAPGGNLLCCANTHRLNLKNFAAVLKIVCPPNSEFEWYPMPPDFTGSPYLKSLWVQT